MNAIQVLAYAKMYNINGSFLRKFANGQELREYIIPTLSYPARIRAFAHEHN